MDSVTDTPSLGWVAPFGDPRIEACSRLPGAFRSVPRPSSPLDAKASTRCPSLARPAPAAGPPGTARRIPMPDAGASRGTTGARQSARPRGPGGPGGRLARRHHTMSEETAPPTRRRAGPARPGAGRVPEAADRRPTRGDGWWARADSNGRPHAYQACALTG